jgi:hypothetical protein
MCSLSNVAKFERLVGRDGSVVTYHRESGGTVCPCVSPEGYRSPAWHLVHPLSPVCNEQGRLNPVVIDAKVKAFVQPVQSGATRRLTGEYIDQMFGEVQVDDHIGIFPLKFDGVTIDFQDWSRAGEDYILYDGRRFTIVSVNKIPDPDGGLPHHTEAGLRLVKTARPNG